MAKKKSETKIDSEIKRVMAKHLFSDAELIELGKAAYREQQTIESEEECLKSIKSDFKSRIEAAENRRNNAFRKQGDGYEMREVEAVVEYNTPEPGQKTSYFHHPGRKNPRGEVIAVEPMTGADLQRGLFEEETAEPKEFTNPVLPVPTAREVREALQDEPRED